MIKTKKIKDRGNRSEILTMPSLVYQVMSRALNAIPLMPSAQRYSLTLCHTHQFIWFRIPKVATRTTFDVFNKADIKLDAEHPHLCHYPVNLYKNYFKFAFVRNPWDRLVSCWLDKVVKFNHFKFSAEKLVEMQEFTNFVSFVEQQDINTCDKHIGSQSRLIDLNNIDYIGRFENFNEHFSKIIEIIGLDLVPISHKNSSKNRLSYEQYYDEKSIQKVAKIYRKDIDIFAYDFIGNKN